MELEVDNSEYEDYSEYTDPDERTDLAFLKRTDSMMDEIVHNPTGNGSGTKVSITN